jgi:hypothetical protein
MRLTDGRRLKPSGVRAAPFVADNPGHLLELFWADSACCHLNDPLQTFGWTGIGAVFYGRNRGRFPVFRLSPTSGGLENSSYHIKIRHVKQAYSGYGNQERKQYPTGTDCG